MAENALLAAIGCYSAVGDYASVRDMFRRLADLPLDEKKRQRYAKISERYVGANREHGEAPGLPDYLKKRNAYADIWFADLVEWELGGDPHRVAASIVGDLGCPNVVRRRALVVVLIAADAAHRSRGTSTQTLRELAGFLGELTSYAALNPLEKLYEHDDASVRHAAVLALRHLFFKRSFVIIRKALADPNAEVREAAIEALPGLKFTHAFNPLAQIYRESDEPKVQIAALRSIGAIQNLEAGEFLIMVLRQEEGRLREEARRSLAAFDNADIMPILRHYLEIENNPQVRELLDGLLNRDSGLR